MKKKPTRIISRILSFTLAFMMMFSSFTSASAADTGRTPGSIPDRTYIIGTHEFTSGFALTTSRIMIAARTIQGDNLTEEDMVIYYKDPLVGWINATDGKPIPQDELPQSFTITHTDLVGEVVVDKNITSVAAIADINVANGTALSAAGLPTTVVVTLDDETTQNLAVTWDDGTPAYDKDTAGQYVFAGTLTLVDGIANAGDYKATVKVIVAAANVQVSAISVDKEELTLTAGGATGTITATVSPAGATNKTVTWTSSNEAVATVAGGVVTPLTVGTTTITATTVDGSFTATCEVTVNAQGLATATAGLFGIGTVDPFFGNVSVDLTLNHEGKTYANVESLEISLYNGDELLATNKAIVALTGTVTTSPFLIGRTEAVDAFSWHRGAYPIVGALPTENEIPNKVVATYVIGGTTYVSESEISLILPNSVVNISGESNKYYTEIQAAINVATAGDVIIVGDGEYTENLTINKAITLKSLNGRESTEIAGTITIEPLDDEKLQDVTVEGFTVTAPAGYKAYPVIHMNNLENVNILNNSVVADDTAYGAIGTSDGPAKVTGTISGNIVTGMIMAGTDGKLEFSDNVVTLTSASSEGITFYPVGPTAEITVTGNTVGAVTEGNVQIKVNERPASVNEKTTAVEMLAAISADNNGATAKLAWLSDSIAVIGATGYSTLQEAIDAANSGETINILSDVSFVGITTGAKSLTFMGTDAKPSIGFPKGKNYNYQTYSGSEFTFENLTLDFDPTHIYHGIQPAKLTVKNSVINGTLWGYAQDIVVTDSVFNQNTDGYNMWTYASNVTIERSEFNSAGRSVLIYNEGATQYNPAKIVFNECEFINKGEVVSEKAAIEISTDAYPDKAGSFIVEIDNCSATGFDTETPAGGVVLSPGLAHLKKIGVGTLTVTIDGQEMYPVMVK